MYEIISEQEGRVVGIRARGAFSGQELEELGAFLEHQVERHGAISMLVEIEDVDAGAETAFLDGLPAGRRAEVERIAIVGDRSREKEVAGLTASFPGAAVEYFDQAHLAEAWSWVRGKV